jgi:ABC-2 type transport system permease protein
VILASMALFGLPMRGTWIGLSILLAVFLVGALGTGLLVSTMADTQQVAYQSAMLVAFLPSFILSGFIFPIASMPVALQYITALVPARYFLTALRGVVLKGLTLGQLWQPMTALVLYALLMLGLSAARLARR